MDIRNVRHLHEWIEAWGGEEKIAKSHRLGDMIKTRASIYVSLHGHTGSTSQAAEDEREILKELGEIARRFEVTFPLFGSRPCFFPMLAGVIPERCPGPCAACDARTA